MSLSYRVLRQKLLMAKVRLEAVTRRFENVTAIEDITFEVPDGEFWVLVGPSGCGKSTIMRTIAGLESVSSGKIYLDDILVNEIPARQRDVAMVFQNYALYPHMTVAENLAFGLQMRKIDKETIAKRIEIVARSLDIAHLLNRKPKQLSGGQQQRVALGRAIARQPKVFLLDEPLSNLDAQLRDDTRAELKRLHAQVGITTIYVTHDQVEAMTLGDRLVVLERGRIQQVGRPQDVYAYPANLMVATFLGSPPMNILPASCINDKFMVCDNLLPIPEEMYKKIQPSAGEGFNLGIRPENIWARSSESGENLGKLSIEVELVEPLGRETLVRGKLPNSEVRVNFIAPASWQESPGSHVAIQLDLDKLFVFDPSSGKTVYP